LPRSLNSRNSGGISVLYWDEALAIFDAHRTYRD
jgi:hypothetical protein